MLKQDQKGYLGVITVLIVSAITVTAAVTITFLGINQMLYGLALDQSEVALQMADGCAEEGYYRLKSDPAYTGGTVPYSGGTCTITVSGGGSTRTITATATVGSYTRTVDSDLSLETNVDTTTEGVDLTSWEEM